jgi:hypothetical protein
MNTSEVNKQFEPFEGKRVGSIEYADAHSYEPTTVVITFDDGTELKFNASSVMYDQYSSSPCLTHTLPEA